MSVAERDSAEASDIERVETECFSRVALGVPGVGRVSECGPAWMGVLSAEGWGGSEDGPVTEVERSLGAAAAMEGAADGVGAAGAGVGAAAGAGAAAEGTTATEGTAAAGGATATEDEPCARVGSRARGYGVGEG